MMKTIKDLKKWKDIPWLWIGILRIVKISFLLNLIYVFNTIN